MQRLPGLLWLCRVVCTGLGVVCSYAVGPQWTLEKTLGNGLDFFLEGNK